MTNLEPEWITGSALIQELGWHDAYKLYQIIRDDFPNLPIYEGESEISRISLEELEFEIGAEAEEVLVNQSRNSNQAELKAIESIIPSLSFRTADVQVFRKIKKRDAFQALAG